MDHRIINPFRIDLLIRHIHKSFNNLRKSTSGSHMTACIFIKQSVVEHQTGLIDRRLLRNQCHFTKHGSTLIHRKHFLQDFFPLLSVAVYHSSVFKINRKMIDDLSGTA